MGSKYTTLATSGYNSSPPADDGSQTASNLITWAAQKTKLADPVKTLADSINTALVTAFDYSVRQITSSDNTVAGDHMKCIEIAPTVTTAVTISLGDAVTMTSNYRVFVKNSSNRNQTLTRVTSGDTIDGTAGTVTIPPGCGFVVQTNATPNGYLIVGRYAPSDGGVLSSLAGTNTITASLTGLPGYGAGQTFQFIPAATNTAATTLNINSLGAKNVFWNGAACSGGELLINVPTLVQYDGTQFNVCGPMIGTRITSALGADVNLNNTGTYFTGPTVAQGTVGTWFVIGTVTVQDTAGTAAIGAKLWDGTTVINSASGGIAGANNLAAITLSGYISNPVGNLRISVIDGTSTSGLLKFNYSGNSKDCHISAIRIA